MKKIIYIIALLVFLGCQEDNLKPEIIYENSYSIQDDPNDPVKHRRYNIYKEYGVPVYFNDTINKIYSGVDLKGDPYYTYETIDLAWGFSYYDDYVYEFEYITDPDEQMEALEFVESYLTLTSKALHPFSFLVTKSAVRINVKTDAETSINPGSYGILFRTLFLTSGWSEAAKENLPTEIMRQMVSTKISQYEEDLGYFYSVSDKSWYGVFWYKLDPSLPQTPAFQCNALYEGATKPAWQSEEDYQAHIIFCREAIGKYGFVSGSSGSLKGLETPSNTGDDLSSYIKEMLKYSPAEFEELWGHSPLVMEKYNILYDIVAVKMGVEL